MNRLAVVACALALAVPASSRADGCTAARVDVTGWPIVRSASLPGFTLRLPRAYVRDAVGAPRDSAPSARWSAAARARFTMSHRAAGAGASALPASDGRVAYTRCEERVGVATAVILSSGGTSPGTYVVLARIRWPDGEELDVRADAADREHLDQLLAAVRTIRRAGA
ncbi:MAG TPA: hypothetical protein VFS59_16575 [Gemmatimonadaceae bacterium]|nr:hypothetical protein [Gemmatimonadaceae bacterium]